VNIENWVPLGIHAIGRNAIPFLNIMFATFESLIVASTLVQKAARITETFMVGQLNCLFAL